MQPSPYSTQSAPPANRTTISLYRKVSAEDVPPYGLQKIAEEEKLFTKPTLLCCGGLMVNDNRHNNEELANGFAKVGHALLGYNKTLGNNDPIDILSISYPHSETVLSQGVWDYTNKKLHGADAPDSGFATQFAQQHLFPLIEDENGKARDLATMKKNLRNVTILAHSYGALFTQQVGNALADRMKDLGMNEADIHEATSQVVVVAAGPTVPLAAGKASFRTFNVINSHDSELGKLCDTRAMIADMLAVSPAGQSLLVDDENKPVSRTKPRTHHERLMGSRNYFTKPLNIMPVALKPDTERPELAIAPQSNEFVVSYSPPLWVNGLKQVIEKPTSNPYGFTDDVRAGEGTTKFIAKDDSSHNPSSYFHYNLEKDGSLTRDGHTLRTLMSSVLTNSVSNSIENASQQGFIPLPAAQELLKLPEKTPYTMADDVNFVASMRSKGYNERIQEALLLSEQATGRS